MAKDKPKDPPPAPPADVITPDPPERAAPAPAEAAPVARGTLATETETVLFAALARVARLHGYGDEHIPEHVGDFDSSKADPRVRGLVEWAKGARLP